MKIVLVIVVACIVIALGYFLYAGAFASVRITEQEHAPFTFAYREIGSSEMREIGPITDQLDSLSQSAGIVNRKPLDIFYPDGRGEIGFAVEGATVAQLASLGAGAKVRIIPAQRYMVSAFPWKSRSSYMLGYMKVDPKLAAWRAAHNYKKVEAFALNEGKTILYLQPIVPNSP